MCDFSFCLLFCTVKGIKKQNMKKIGGDKYVLFMGVVHAQYLSLACN